MFPCPSLNNVEDSVVRNAKQFPKLLVFISCGVKFPYFYNLTFIKQGVTISVTSWICSMPVAILVVVMWSVISQIYKKVVSWNSIFVATFKVLWAWPDKGKQNQAMHEKKVLLGVFIQTGSQVSTTVGALAKDSLGMVFQNKCSAQSLSQAFLLPKRPNPPPVADLITRKSRNIFPNFVRGVKVAFSHGATLLIRVGAGVRAVAVFHHRCGSFFISYCQTI